MQEAVNSLKDAVRRTEDGFEANQAATAEKLAILEEGNLVRGTALGGVDAAKDAAVVTCGKCCCCCSIINTCRW